MRKSRVVTILVCIIMLMVSAFAFSACEIEDFIFGDDITINTPNENLDREDPSNDTSHTHTYDKQVAEEKYLASEATCTVRAKYYYSCECGAKGMTTFEYGTLLGHSYTNYVSDNNATCVNDGTETAICDHGCGTKDTRVQENSAIGHDYGKWVSNGNGTHTKTCKNDSEHTVTENCHGGSATCTEQATCVDCNAKYGEVKAHTYDKQVAEEKYLASEATCTVRAKYYYSCECGAKGMTTFEYGEKAAHIEVIDVAVDATFSLSGLTAGSHCSICNETIIAQQEIPALGLNNGTEQDVIVSTEYRDEIEGVSYRYSYSLTVKDESFVLTTLTIGSDETYSINYSCGTISLVRDGIHELRFDDDRDLMYIKFIDGKFEFCKKDGSKWDKEKYDRVDGITDIDLVPRLGNSVYGYRDLANNVHGKSMQELYRRMYYACEAFVNNTDDIQCTNGYYVLDTIDLSRYIINVNEVVAVWKIFTVENPRYYWLANSLTVNGSNLNFCIDEAYSKVNYRVQCDNSIDNMLEECNSLIDDAMSELEIALTIHDFIIDRMDYAYENDGITPQDDIWAHNMVGCAKYNLGVCESFAKTFMFLCRYNGVENIIITGTANNESHAWNVVKMDDLWYGIDVTWDETNKAGLISYNCFGMSKTYCDSMHNADSFDKTGINYLYKLPKMNENSIELVDVLKNGNYIGTYVNIDKAFECMTDINADYTIQLYSYALQGPLLLATPSIVHNIYSVKTPNVNRITIKGAFNELVNGFVSVTSVVINNSLTVLTDTLTLYDINLNGSGGLLYIQNNCLELAGQYCDMHVSIIGNIREGATSKILCNTKSTSNNTIFWNNIEVYEMYALGYVELRGTSTIICLKAYDFRIYGGDASIENLYGIESHCVIWLSAMANINIQNLYSNSDEIIIYNKFGKLEEFSQLTLGHIKGNVEIRLLGTVHYLITDVFGNEINRYTEKVNPFNVNKPIAHLSQKSELEKVKITYDVAEKTSLYTVDENGDIILKSYEVKDGLIVIDNVIVHYDGKDTVLNIPEGITTIGENVFLGNNTLISVTIPNSVTNIGYKAFVSCISLTSVTIPNSVTSIGDYAFSYCSSLTSVTIPNSVTSIGDYAFSCCDKLVEVINNSSLDITKGSQDNGYVGCYALNVKKGGESEIVNKNGYLFYTYNNVNYLLGYIGNETNLALPDNYNGESYEIYKYAFYGCSSLTSVTIPNSVTSIGDSAFYGCSSLTSVTIPNSVTSIGDSAFCGCSSLTSVTIPNSVTSIGDSAFCYCSGLTSVTIGNSVTNIGDFAFLDCDGLTSITIPNSVTSIGYEAFSNCSSLTSVTFKDTSGWYVSTSSTATSGFDLTLTDASRNAEYLKSIYNRYYWKRK